MSKKETKEKKKGMSRSALVLIIGLVIILIPCCVFGGILLKSYLDSKNPVIADRFEGDLDPAITEEDIEKVRSSVSSMSGVESVEVNLTTAQFRVNVDTKDDITKEEAEALTNDVYNKVNAILPVTRYFTATETMKMYDLSISVYNKVGNDDGKMIYYLLTKNSKMEAPSVQLVSEPLDEELAKELRGEGESESGEVSVNESDLNQETSEGEGDE